MRSCPMALPGLAAFGLFAACFADGSGLDADMRVPKGEYVEGPMPRDDGGPEVLTVLINNATIRPGQRAKPLEGSVARSATGVAIGLQGDSGYWLVPAELPDVVAPDFPTYNVALDFSQQLAIEERTLWVAASDEEGRFGPPMTALLTPVPTAALDARLVFTLSWDTLSDLDLHVVDPNGVEIFKRDINSFQFPPPGEPPPPPGATDKGGVLDFDSNAQCLLDGRCIESVIWKVEPPSGRYIARVDTFSLCDALSAHWVVTAVLDGAIIAEARGTASQEDTRLPHDRGAGVTALEIDVP